MVAVDVLEHLRDPNRLLEDCKAALAERGRMIISVPNTANFTVRFMLLFGSFRYSDRGILDWSHLRFFTRKTIREMLRKHGYRITGEHFTILPMERVVPVRPDTPVLRLLNQVLRALTWLLPGLLAYEIVIVAER